MRCPVLFVPAADGVLTILRLYLSRNYALAAGSQPPRKAFEVLVVAP